MLTIFNIFPNADNGSDDDGDDSVEFPIEDGGGEDDD